MSKAFTFIAVILGFVDDRTLFTSTSVIQRENTLDFTCPDENVHFLPVLLK